MKAAEKIIIYDDACPMCAAYTKAFASLGFLSNNGRQCFSNIDAAMLSRIDFNKSRNEIPLINTTNNTVLYGIDAMLEVLSSRLPLIKIIGTIQPVNWFLKKLYNFISYNRRVITASSISNNNFDCTPDFNIRYRILFLFIGFCFNTLMLVPTYRYVFVNSIFANTSMFKLQTAHFILVLINFALPFKLSVKKAFEFLGQINMTALIYSLLLIPLIFINKVIAIPGYINNTYLLAVFCIMIITYRRRMQYAGILQYKYIQVADAVSAASFLIFLIAA